VVVVEVACRKAAQRPRTASPDESMSRTLHHWDTGITRVSPALVLFAIRTPPAVVPARYSNPTALVLAKKRELLVRYSFLFVFLLVRYSYLVVFLLVHGRVKKNSYSSVDEYGPGTTSGTYEYGKCPLSSLTRTRTRT